MKRKFGMADKLGYMFGDFGYVFVEILYGCDGRIGGSRWYDDDGSAAA